ncbi:Hypothetical predicted protein [Marmota monax]|uniref:Uncharacterized protein n=1 Tax=Marmota monax TaxID=9995 RepID=A0A5E4AFD2_MARMO|nr:Hypothetical predicted protein [Marmota monax]
MVLNYAVNPDRLLSPAANRLILESGPWGEWRAYLLKDSSVSKTLCSELGGGGFLTDKKRNTSHCFNCCLGLRNLPFPQSFLKGDPGFQIPWGTGLSVETDDPLC